MNALPDQPRRPPGDGARAFVTLDGLRGVAALVIAARHAPFLWPMGSPTGVFYESYLSVDFFFVLSGFVLSHAYADRFANGLSARQFMLLRIKRLYPLYFVSLIFSMAIAAGQYIHGNIGATKIVTDGIFAIFFLPSPFSAGPLFPMNLLAWSLFFELVANLLFGLAGRRLDTRLLYAVVAAAALTLLWAAPFGRLGFGTGNGAMDAGAQWPSIGAGMVRVTYSFFAGVLCYRLWKSRGAGIVLPPAILVASLCVVVASCPPARYQTAFDLFAALLAFPLLVFLGACSVPGPRAARLFAWLGGISYGVYILQAPLYDIVGSLIAAAVGVNLSGASLFWGAASVVLVVELVIIAERILTEFLSRPGARAFLARTAE